MLRTKKQERDLCSDCPLAKAAHLIGDTSTLLIMRDLLSGTKRFGELENSLSGISSRTITNKLKLLEKKGLIKRIAFEEKPPRVEYSLMENGRALKDIINSMKSYGEKYL